MVRQVRMHDLHGHRAPTRRQAQEHLAHSARAQPGMKYEIAHPRRISSRQRLHPTPLRHHAPLPNHQDVGPVP
ncbi:hypothetical protein ACFRCG_33435 [Embleya sp. NPDC056575]|uniref:hypothetical protein n=1 Tax=unclassified Embleya TaxID=2699296 RepID=UPI0036CD5A07